MVPQTESHQDIILIQSHSNCSGPMGVTLVDTWGVESGHMLEGQEDFLKHFEMLHFSVLQ